jgi:uncharacterized protein (TIGR02118 family)
MIKQISLIYRPAGVSKEEFRTYWRDVHAELVKTKLPGLRKYTGSFPLEARPGERLPGGGEQIHCDCVVELYFDDLDSLMKAMTGPDWLGEDRMKSSLKILDFKRVQFIVADEYVVPL